MLWDIWFVIMNKTQLIHIHREMIVGRYNLLKDWKHSPRTVVLWGYIRYWGSDSSSWEFQRRKYAKVLVRKGGVKIKNTPGEGRLSLSYSYFSEERCHLILCFPVVKQKRERRNLGLCPQCKSHNLFFQRTFDLVASKSIQLSLIFHNIVILLPTSSYSLWFLIVWPLTQFAYIFK